MKLKANHNIILPDGQAVKAGELFEYNGDLNVIASVVEVVAESDSEDNQPVRRRRRKVEE